MLFTLFYFFLALLLLIIVHELGHFLVARWCGVKVLRFSFGFGKVLARWHDKRGTEYAWSLFPLGGYIKMLDENEGEVLPHERHLAFNNQTIWVRIAIVLAGPVFNLLFAFVMLWLVLVIGIHSIAPIIGQVKPNSIAAQAGLREQQEIISLNDKKIQSWHDFHYALMPLVGSHDVVKISVRTDHGKQKNTALLALADWQLDIKKPDALGSLGITPFFPIIPPIVGELTLDSPAERAGLQVGDVILSIQDQNIVDWLKLVNFVVQHPGEKVSLTVKRHEQNKTLTLTIGQTQNNGKTIGFLGVRSQRVEWPKHWLRLQQEAPIPALATALKQTIDLTKSTVVLMGRLVVGQLPIQSISGPVGIAQGAGEAAQSGLIYYLSFLAIVSISLGVLNLLPIPMLDGGHLLYYFIELIRRRPLSERAKSMGVMVGLSLLVMLTVIALKNDLTRLVG